MAWKHGSLILLALDWRRAFDSISPTGLIAALVRFGLPSAMVDAISDIYRDRVFTVADCGKTSEHMPQKAGISQGCPLSPFLFTIVMTVLMSDAVSSLGEAAKAEYNKGALADILYADDTLLLGVEVAHLEEFMSSIEKTCSEYGLQLHWGKVQCVAINSTETVRKPSGERLQPTDSMVYIGSLLHADGKATSEVSQRLGMCMALFRNLNRVWSHANISRDRKLEILKSLIESKVCYG